MPEWIDDPDYQSVCGELLTDPSKTLADINEYLAGIVRRDDHDVTPVDPGWFTSFDEVDSRTVQNVGAPE